MLGFSTCPDGQVVLGHSHSHVVGFCTLGAVQVTDGQAQTPATQADLGAEQPLPQVPQLSGSVVVSTHWLPQRVSPGAQVETQTPPTHVWPLVQVDSQRPLVGSQSSQLVASQAVARQLSPQTRVSGQQTPPTHVWPLVQADTQLRLVGSQSSHFALSQLAQVAPFLPQEATVVPG